MKKSLLPLLTFFLSIASAHAVFEAHGGGAFVCRNSSGKILAEPLSVELLDLWEAETLTPLHLMRNQMAQNPIQQNIEMAFTRLKSWDLALWQDSFGYNVLQTGLMSPIPTGTAIAAPTDVGSLFIKKGCPLEGVASYNDQDDTLSYDPEIVSAMGSVDYAAMIVHESIYKARRVYDGDVDSIQSRKIVGFLFSDAAMPDFYQNPPSDARYCTTYPASMSFMLSRTPSDSPNFEYSYHFEFSRINDAPLMAATKIQVPSTAPTDLVAQLYAGTAPNAAMVTGMLDPTKWQEPNMQLNLKSNLESFQVLLIEDQSSPQIRCQSTATRFLAKNLRAN